MWRSGLLGRANSRSRRFAGRRSSRLTECLDDRTRLSAGVTIVPTGKSTMVAEGGPADTYTVVLDRQPTADVTIAFDFDSQVDVSPTSLAFTPLNWNMPRTVTLTAVNDTVAEGV